MLCAPSLACASSEPKPLRGERGLPKAPLCARTRRAVGQQPSVTLKSCGQSRLCSSHRWPLFARFLIQAIECALRAGKDVISEKPAASDAAAAARLWSAQNESGRVWCVLENWAYKPGVLRVAELLRDGAAGEVASYRLTLRKVLPSAAELGWRANATNGYTGGHLLDVGVHAVRACRHWFGEVRSVRATAPLVPLGDCGDGRVLSDGILVHEGGVRGELCLLVGS